MHNDRCATRVAKEFSMRIGKMPSVMFPLSKAVVGFVRIVAIFCESFSAPLLSDVVNARKIV